ncbi:MAG: serine hydrolase [Pseudonocardiaceae bacterium]
MTTAATPVPSPPDRTTVAAKVQQAMHAVLPKAQVGFAVFDRQNDTVLTSQDADRQFASMSVVKLLIALDALAGDNWATPDDTMQQELHQMLADSDDDIANNLWSANGGPAIVTRMVGLLGLTGTQPPENPSRWGNTLITPQDMVTVYRYITDQLSYPAQDLLLGALTDAPQIAADGFDQHFGIPEGMPNTTWAVKQGWGTSGSQAVMNSTGLVGAGLRYVVVVLVSGPAHSYSTVPAVVTAGARALADSLGVAES